MTLFDLTGRVAIVTGGNGGIGLGMALGMVACGATIVVAGRDQEKARLALASLRELGAQCAFMAADVTKKAACVKLVSDTVAEFGRLDILVNNAGTAIRKMPQDYTEEEWHHVLDTNLTSAFLCSQAAYAPMKQAGGGKMINIGSMMSLFGAPYATPYASSKGGIVQMTRALATASARELTNSNREQSHRAPRVIQIVAPVSHGWREYLETRAKPFQALFNGAQPRRCCRICQARPRRPWLRYCRCHR